MDRECDIRFYSPGEKHQRQIPSPYDRGGVGDFYFVIDQDFEGDGLGPVPVDMTQNLEMKEGWDPLNLASQSPPMLGLDLFCGGGSFGRGLEEGKAVRFAWAVDWFTEAVHTYKANSNHDDETEIFQGSVNDYLTQALQGQGDSVVV